MKHVWLLGFLCCCGLCHFSAQSNAEDKNKPRMREWGVKFYIVETKDFDIAQQLVKGAWAEPPGEKLKRLLRRRGKVAREIRLVRRDGDQAVVGAYFNSKRERCVLEIAPDDDAPMRFTVARFYYMDDDVKRGVRAMQRSRAYLNKEIKDGFIAQVGFSVIYTGGKTRKAFKAAEFRYILLSVKDCDQKSVKGLFLKYQGKRRSPLP